MNPLFKQANDRTWLWAITGDPVQAPDRRYFGLESDPAQRAACYPKMRLVTLEDRKFVNQDITLGIPPGYVTR